MVEDLSGSGVSSVSVEITASNHGEMAGDRCSFFYSDNPRKGVDQNLEHTNVCSLFAPFIRAIEVDIASSNWMDMHYSPDADDIDDTLIGLPAN